MYVTWFEGRIALDLDDALLAERLLIAAQSGFVGVDAQDQARLVGLDLAIAYATQAKNAKALEVIQDVLEVLEHWREDHPRIAAAWRTLKRASMAQSISTDDLIAVQQIMDSFQEDPSSRRYFDFSAIAI